MSSIQKKKVQPMVIGCNYHTTWQSDKAMRFILVGVNKHEAILTTRSNRKEFKTNVEDLIFICTRHNISKAASLLQHQHNLLNSIIRP